MVTDNRMSVRLSDVNKLRSLLYVIRNKLATNGRLSAEDRSELFPLVSTAQNVIKGMIQLSLFTDAQMAVEIVSPKPSIGWDGKCVSCGSVNGHLETCERK